MLINQRTSVEARESAVKMEQMTSRMEDIAIKTEEETVSMRIVTYVTLFFLPGTFVSVRYTYYKACYHHLFSNNIVQTVMSTDILQYSTDNSVQTETVSLGALKTWIAMTLPLMMITFLSSYLVRRKEGQRVTKRRNKVD